MDIFDIRVVDIPLEIIGIAFDSRLLSRAGSLDESSVLVSILLEGLVQTKKLVNARPLSTMGL